MDKKLTDRLESFSNLLDSLNDRNKKKPILKLRSISKLNRLKEMMKGISFLADKNENDKIKEKSLGSERRLAEEIKRIKNEKNECIIIAKECMRSAMVKIISLPFSKKKLFSENFF